MSKVQILMKSKRTAYPIDISKSEAVVEKVGEWLAKYAKCIQEDDLSFSNSTFSEDAEALLDMIKAIDPDYIIWKESEDAPHD